MLDLGRRVLVLGAHTDDEFACSGTISRLIEEGAEVYCAIFSSCEESVPVGFDRDVLKQEAQDAMAVLGIPAENFWLFDFPVRRFPEHRQEILEQLIQLRAQVAPDLVLLPALSDLHQDHGVVAQEGLRAFKHATVLGYEMPMNTVVFQHACFIQLEPRHIKRKLTHLCSYRSQQGRPYFRAEFIRSLATVRGLQMNAEAAEAFEVVRMCLKSGASHVE